MFLALGITNVRRNLGRSLLAVLGAALAAMIITSMLGLTSGYPAMGYLETRAFMAADIVVYRAPHLVQPGAFSGEGAAASGSWQLTRLGGDELCDLLSLHPELYTSGFLAPGDGGHGPLSVTDIAERVAGINGVSGLTPSYFLPLRLEFDVPNEDGRTTRVVTVPDAILRGRDFEFANLEGGWAFDRLVVSGTTPAGSEPAAAVGWIDRRLATLGYEAQPAVNDRVRLYVPAVDVASDGTWTYDFTRESVFEVTIAGEYEVPVGIAAWPLPEGGTATEELYWITPQLQVSSDLFTEVFAAVSAGLKPQHALQLGIAARPFSSIENLAADVQAALPGYSVITVPRQLNMAGARGLPGAAFRAPFDALGRPTTQQVGLPVNLNRAIIVTVSLVAALLLAANMLFLVAGRRREIGVLKAVGARSSDVAVMVLAEALTLNLAGTLAGFLIIRLLATWTLVSNHIALGDIAKATLNDLGIVLGAGVSAAAVFALVPAWQMARLTSLEVLRNE